MSSIEDLARSKPPVSARLGEVYSMIFRFVKCYGRAS